MKGHSRTVVSMGILAWLAVLTPALKAAEQPEQLLLFDFGSGFDLSSVISSDAKATLSTTGTLRIETGKTVPWPGITLKAPAGKWDLSQYQHISMDVRNMGDKPVTVHCRVDNPGADGNKNCVSDGVTLELRASRTLTVRVFPVPWRLSEPAEIVGMRASPTHSAKIDASNVVQLLVFVDKPTANHVFEIGKIRAAGRVETLDTKTFFPFIDEFGQYIHKDWPGKTHSLEELMASAKAEEKDLAEQPGPATRSKYGGWTAGPRLEATGFFRVEKYQGKWWLVDPDGYLFWSHGIDCVRSGNATPITGREHYFRNLPSQDSPLATFYGSGNWAPHGYYKDHSPYKTYDFSRANLQQKYGEDFERASAQIVHRRLRSWGLNTIANWSDESVYLMRKTAYVGTISFESKKIEGSQGYWGKFYDVFDPQFRQVLRNRLSREKDRTAGDPWCIGYFVSNELSWGDEVSLSEAALMSPADQPAKKVFIEDLKIKYETIDKLNAAWGTAHPSWDALLQNQQAPDRKRVWDDLTAFYTKIAEAYFATIRDQLKEIAPNQLYMGCRFAWVNDRAARAAAKYCDIVSYNRYTYTVEDLRLPDSIDKPLIIGEFHFGALDRGLFHTGLKETADQQDRANKYKSYVLGALRNAYIVGTHWFQYQDQATTGRGDGENYQIGFIDICDTPYPEIIQASREIGHAWHELRLKSN